MTRNGMRIASALLLLAAGGGAPAQEEPFVEYDARFGVRITTTATAVLLPGEPVRIIPVLEWDRRLFEGWTDCRVWIASPEGRWYRVDVAWMEGYGTWRDDRAPGGPLPTEVLERPFNLVVLPWQELRGAPRELGTPWSGFPQGAPAFPTPGIWRVRLAGRGRFLDAAGAQQETPLVASNILDFQVVPIPATEEEPADIILSRGWFTPNFLAGTAREEMQQVVQEYPGSRYVDYLRLRLVRGLPRWIYTPDRFPADQGREDLERDLQLIDDIDPMEGFTWADLALATRVEILTRLGRSAEARQTWQELQALPYPSPYKRVRCPD